MIARVVWLNSNTYVLKGKKKRKKKTYRITRIIAERYNVHTEIFVYSRNVLGFVRTVFRDRAPGRFFAFARVVCNEARRRELRCKETNGQTNDDVVDEFGED